MNQDDSVDATRGVGRHDGTPVQNSRHYSNIMASGSSRLHIGDVHHCAIYHYSCGHDRSPVSSVQAWRDVIRGEAEGLALQRGTYLGDARANARRGEEPEHLAVVLNSLGNFSKSELHLTEGQQSKSVAALLAVVLDTLKQVTMGEALSGDGDRQVQDLKDQLKRTKHISINAACPRLQNAQLSRADSKIFSIAIEDWQISLTVKTVISQRTNGAFEDQIYSTLHVQPIRGFSGARVTAIFREKTDIREMSTLHPIVLAYNQISHTARVFELVANDDLRNLMLLFGDGEATVRDCDEERRSLLFYACLHASVETCNFLIDNGAELDRFHSDYYRLPSYHYIDNANFTTTVPHTRQHLSWLSDSPIKTSEEATPDDLSLAEKLCFKQGQIRPSLTTKATFDRQFPSLSTGTSIAEAQEYVKDCRPCCQQRSLTRLIDRKEFFDLLLREGSTFINLRDFRENGRSLWLQSCRRQCSQHTPAMLQALITAGVNVEETDGNGWNCLFQRVLGSVSPENSYDLGALRFLLTVFDDVFARDNQGMSIFEIVNDERELLVRSDGDDDSCGSYRQDLWYCALYRSELQVRFNLPPPSRNSRFTSRYTSQHYRALMYLTHWADDSIWKHSQPDEHSLSAEEAYRAPVNAEWDTSRLLMMQRRAIGT